MLRPADLSHPAARRPDGAALAFSACAAIFWGTNFEAMVIVLREMGPFTAASVRFATAAASLVLWLWWTRGIDRTVLRRNGLAFAVLGMVGVAGFNGALFLGMRTSSPVTAALIMGTSPLTTSLLDALLQRRLPGLTPVIGMAISLFGIALTVGAFKGTHFASGDVLILIGSLVWALYTIGCRRWVQQASPLDISAWTMVSGAIGLVAMALCIETPVVALGAAHATSWALLIWMALPGSVLAYLFWQIGVAARGPAATSVLFNLVPISALMVAASFGRLPDLSQIAGVVIAIGGVLLASGRPGRR